MDIQIATVLHEDVLLVTATGRVTFDSAVRLYKLASDLAAEKQVHKILINALGLSGCPSTMEKYALGVKIAAYAAQPGIHPRFAVVGIPPTVDGFVAQVAQNRNATIEVFPTQEKALDWLDKWRISV